MFVFNFFANITLAVLMIFLNAEGSGAKSCYWICFLFILESQVTPVRHPVLVHSRLGALPYSGPGLLKRLSAVITLI